MNDLSMAVTVIGLGLWVLVWVAEKVWNACCLLGSKNR